MLADKLGFNDQGYTDALRELRRDNHKRGFWSTGHNRAYSEDLRLLVDLEKHADQIRAAQVEVIPGLLQCESYVRAVHADHPEQNVPRSLFGDAAVCADELLIEHVNPYATVPMSHPCR